MDKKTFLILWSLFLLAGYFLYFSPLSLYHLNEKLTLIEKLTEKNSYLKNQNILIPEEKPEMEIQDYFVEMGYAEKNQIIVDIRLPIINKDNNTLDRWNNQEPSHINNSLVLSALIFFFFLSLIIIFYFKDYYQNKGDHS